MIRGFTKDKKKEDFLNHVMETADKFYDNAVKHNADYINGELRMNFSKSSSLKAFGEIRTCCATVCQVELLFQPLEEKK